jgi:TP901-1 family phage major tail protein
MANKYAAYGAKLQYGVGNTDLAGIRGLTGPTFSSETVDVTTHDSTGGLREIVPSLRDGGEVSLDLVFDPQDVGHIKLTTDWKNAVLEDYQIVLVDAGTTTWSFQAYVTSFDMDNPVDDALTASVTLKISGDITF